MKKMKNNTNRSKNVTDLARTIVIVNPMEVIRQGEQALEDILEITRFRQNVLPEAPYQLRQEDRPKPLYFD